MKQWLYKWLPIFFGCHCRDDRSFHCHGEKFPICARCTGELIGMLACLFSAIFYLPSFWTAVILMVPMVFDGFLQLLTPYESTNTRRVITGTLFGYAFMTMILLYSISAFRFGYNLTQ